MTLMKPPPFPLPLRILTHNIRYATTSPFRGEEPWPIRLPGLLSSLHFHTQYMPTAIICLQEVLHSQLLDILSGLNSPTHSSPLDTPQWASIGVGRDDGVHAGEYSPILYRTAVFSLLRSRTLWLSETPQIPGSKSWDASLPRILTIGVLQHRENKRRIVVMNTHLDDQGARSREEAAKMIVRELHACGLCGQEGSLPPVLLAGDFNSEVDGRAYRVITGDASPLVDLRESVPLRDRYGHENTYTGFGYEEEKRPTRIDFLFARRRDGGGGPGGAAERQGTGLAEGPWRIDGYGVLENCFEDGVVVSDHRAVVADVTLL